MADNLTPAQRSYCMSRVKGRDTAPEMLVRSELHKRGLRFKKHPSGLPGKPDILFTRARLAVFIDGDFWHGYRFPSWENSLSPFWRTKIAATRKRDQRNFSKLRREGWRVIRIWQHSIRRDFDGVIQSIVSAAADREATSAA